MSEKVLLDTDIGSDIDAAVCLAYLLAQTLSRWKHHHQFPRGQAIEFLRQTIRAHPGEIALLAIGPLTNVTLRVGPERFFAHYFSVFG